MLHEIKYPVITFAESSIIYFARNQDDLTISSIKGWRNGFYNSLNIIDSEGNSFDVQEAKKVGYAGLFWGISIISGQKIRVELIYTKANKGLSVVDFKEKILKQLKKDKHFWNAGGNFDELIVKVRNGKSYKEIIAYLTNYFYKSN